MRRPRFEVFVDRRREVEEAEFRWRLVAANGEIVAQSEGYGRLADAERGARAARKAARFASMP